MSKDPHRYDAYIDLPRHVSSKRQPMDPITRASIFSPFAALSGYDGQIRSAGTHRCNKDVLSEYQSEQINNTLNQIHKHSLVTVFFFVHDPGTDGTGGHAEGRYCKITGTVTQIDSVKMRVQTDNNRYDIEFSDIKAITIQKEDHND